MLSQKISAAIRSLQQPRTSEPRGPKIDLFLLPSSHATRRQIFWSVDHELPQVLFALLFTSSAP